MPLQHRACGVVVPVHQCTQRLRIRPLTDRPATARALLARAREHGAGVDMLIVVDQLDHVEATVDVLLGEMPSARALLAGLVEWNEASSRRRLADHYRRDLAALDPAGPD